MPPSQEYEMWKLLATASLSVAGTLGYSQLAHTPDVTRQQVADMIAANNTVLVRSIHDEMKTTVEESMEEAVRRVKETKRQRSLGVIINQRNTWKP